MTEAPRSFEGLRLNLGEGPVWDPTRRELSLVDVLGRRIYRLAWDEGAWALRGSIETEGDVGAALPLGGGSFLSCETEGIFLLDESARDRVAPRPGGRPGQRCNDAKLGPDGHLYVGVLDYDLTEGAGGLWRVDRSGRASLVLGDLTIPNGMDWWEDEFWFVDGPTPIVRCYQWSESGFVSTGREIPTQGTPDGLTIDKSGRIWLALWGEGRVDCFERTGERVGSISVPAPQSTSVALCGPGLDTLAITTAAYDYTDQDRKDFPQAGSVFFARVSAEGREPYQAFRE